jgi:hypothetical protein
MRKRAGPQEGATVEHYRKVQLMKKRLEQIVRSSMRRKKGIM